MEFFNKIKQVRSYSTYNHDTSLKANLFLAKIIAVSPIFTGGNGNGPMAPLVVLVASGEIGKCQ